METHERDVMPDLENTKNILRYVLGAIHDLIGGDELVKTTGVRLQPKGIAQFDQLKASGYKPSDSEIDEALEFLCGERDPEVLAVLVKYKNGGFDYKIEGDSDGNKGS